MGLQERLMSASSFGYATVNKELSKTDQHPPTRMSIFNLRRYRLNIALWYSPPKVNFSSLVFSSLVISRQLTDTYNKKSSKIKFMGKKLLRCKFLVLCFFESLCPLNVLSYFLTDQISPVGQLNMTFIA